MQINIKTLIDDVQCYETVRKLRWPEERQCPFCGFKRVIKRGFDAKEPARQRYVCKKCGKRFDDLTSTIFAGHHQPLKVWILCLYFMGLNLSNKQIAKELDLDRTDVQQMTSQLRGDVVKKVQSKPFKTRWNSMRFTLWQVIEGILRQSPGRSRKVVEIG